jgi:hypothetical protein
MYRTGMADATASCPAVEYSNKAPKSGLAVHFSYLQKLAVHV